MPDNYATLEPDEQKYFDTQGGETSAEVPVTQEQPETPKGPVAKQTKKVGKTASEEPGIAEQEPAVVAQPEKPAVVAKTAEQEQIENLNAALREERSAGKERERLTNQRLQQLQEAIGAARQPVPQPQPEAPPDPEKDALGALKYLLNETRRGQQTQQQTEQERQQLIQQQRIMGEASWMELEFLAQQPDYDANTRVSPSYNEASGFLVNMRRAELMATGAYNPVQINDILRNEAVALAAQAMQNGRNVGQVVMDVARARGFQPTPKQAQEPVKPVVTAPQETEAEKVARIAKGQEAGFSLGQASGSKAPQNKQLDAKMIVGMNQDDFTAFLDKVKKSDLRALMGD